DLTALAWVSSNLDSRSILGSTASHFSLGRDSGGYNLWQEIHLVSHNVLPCASMDSSILFVDVGTVGVVWVIDFLLGLQFIANKTERPMVATRLIFFTIMLHCFLQK